MDSIRMPTRYFRGTVIEGDKIVDPGEELFPAFMTPAEKASFGMPPSQLDRIEARLDRLEAMLMSLGATAPPSADRP